MLICSARCIIWSIIACCCWRMSFGFIKYYSRNATRPRMVADCRRNTRRGCRGGTTILTGEKRRLVLQWPFLPCAKRRKFSVTCQSWWCQLVVPVCAPARLRRERRSVRSHLAENSTPLWSHHSIPRSDETWLPEWSGNLGGVQRWRSSVAWGVWGKPVFRLTASSQLAESLARGRVPFQRDGTSTQAERRPD
jgi:hypothetical protein